jgi:hypothetical protein
VRYSSSSPQRIRRTFVSPISIAPTKSPTGLAPPAAATAMAHLRLLLSHTRRHSQPQRRLPLFRFSSDANSSFALPPPPPIKPVSYAPKPKPPPEEAATSLPPDPRTRCCGSGCRSSLPSGSGRGRKCGL